MSNDQVPHPNTTPDHLAGAGNPIDREAQAREIWRREAETAPRVNGGWDASASVIRAMLAYGEVRAGEERERCAGIADAARHEKMDWAAHNAEAPADLAFLNHIRQDEAFRIAAAIRARPQSGTSS